MNRPGLVTRRPDPTSLSSRKRQATLRVILLPLDIAESADPVPVPAVDYVEPFLPARISAPTTTGDDGPHAQLLAFRHIVDRSSPPITFGIALDNQRAPDSPQRPYVGPPATCLSLWEVPGNGLVLACEELAPDRTGGLIDRHHDPLRGDGSPEFWTAIEAFLRPFGLTPEASPIDVFPRLDTRLPRSEVYRRLRSLTMHSPPRTDRDTVEGLVIEVHTDGVDTVRRLVRRTEHHTLHGSRVPLLPWTITLAPGPAHRQAVASGVRDRDSRGRPRPRRRPRRHRYQSRLPRSGHP